MGNCCCQKSKLCEHSADEARGLLHTQDSAKPLDNEQTGIDQVIMSQESNENNEHIQEDEAAIGAVQLTDSPKSAEKVVVQSSYGSVISSLHTEVSLNAQASQLASSLSQVPEESMAAAATAEEGVNTKQETNTADEFQTLPSDIEDAETDVATESRELDKTGTEGTEAAVVGEVVENNEATKTDQDPSADAQVDLLMETVNVKDLQTEETKQTTEVSDEKALIQNEEPTVNHSTVEKPEAQHLAPEDRTQNDVDPTCSERSTVVVAVESVEEGKVDGKSATVMEPVQNLEDTCKEDATTADVNEASPPSPSQEIPEQVHAPSLEGENEFTADIMENGLVDEANGPREEKESDMVVEVPQTEISQETHEEPPIILSGAELRTDVDAESNSNAVEVEKHAELQTMNADCLEEQGQEQAAESPLNVLDFSTAAETPEATERHDPQTDDPQPLIEATVPSESLAAPDNEILNSEPEPLPTIKAKETTICEEEGSPQSHQVHEGELILTNSHDTKISLIPVSELQSTAEEEKPDLEDLYRGDDEIEEDLSKYKPLLELTIPGAQKCSLAPAVDIQVYSEQEWKGNTAKSILIRKGYSEMSCSFTGLRRVRGDNYCSLRATLYQVLANTAHTPAWLLEEDFTSMPEKLEAEESLIGTWIFPPECNKEDDKKNPVQKLQHYMELLQKRWQEAVESKSLEDKRRVCESVFQSGEEEYGLLEVLKLLMLTKAVELHKKMQEEQEVPVFCWLLFARDTSENPRMFFTNHLSQIGFSGGLEQVEMFLLGYALQHTIQTFRLYKFDTEEFVTHYPDDHKQDWPCVCVVTEDDRHYNVPVRKQAQYRGD